MPPIGKSHIQCLYVQYKQQNCQVCNMKFVVLIAASLKKLSRGV